MSRAFYIPPQTQNFNTVGNSELVDILVATLLSLLDRRHRCQRRCCSRISFHEPNHVSLIKRENLCASKMKKCRKFREMWNLYIFFIQFNFFFNRQAEDVNSEIDEDLKALKSEFPTHLDAWRVEKWILGLILCKKYRYKLILKHQPKDERNVNPQTKPKFTFNQQQKQEKKIKMSNKNCKIEKNV